MTATETDERRGQPSASSFYRYRSCPGSWQLEQEAKRLGQYWKPEKDKFAERGTRIHAYLENPDSVKLEGEEINDALFLKARAEEQVSRIFGQTKTDLHELREKRLFLKELTDWDGIDVSCRFDRAVWNEEIALCQNFKTGWVEPEHPKTNSQTDVEILLIALAALKAGIKAKTFVVQLVTAQFGVLEHKVGYEELARIYEDVTSTLRSLTAERAPLNVNPDVCGKCPAQLICQPLKDQIGPATRLQVAALPLEPKKAAACLDAVSVLYPHLDAIWEFYQAKMEKEPEFLNAMVKQGYDIKPGNERRKFTNLKVAVQRLSEFVDADKIEAAKEATPAALEKLYGESLPGKPKGKELKEAFNKLMSGVLEIKQNAPAMERIRGTPAVKELT